MTCRDFITFLGDYLDEALPPLTVARFESHLAICPSCVAYLASYRQTVALAKDAFVDLEAPVPDDVPEELIAAILASRQGGAR